jgi:hypothetical protein
MDCPQCGAEVPSDNAFCGKCGYARRDHGPERLDQSRIRMHEEPDPDQRQSPGRSSSQHRVRKHTVIGMPSATPPAGGPKSESAPPPAPTSLASARAGRARTPQKTMLGIPRPELLEPAGAESPAEPTDQGLSNRPTGDSGPPSEPAARSHRVRARVRYHSANEPLSVTQRRRNALRGLAVLVLLASAWLGYRLLTVNG